MDDTHLYTDPSGMWSIRYWLEKQYQVSVNFEMLDEGSEIDIEGVVKWDGCMNWRADDYVHFCEPEEADRLAEKFKKVWALALTIMPLADAGYPQIEEVSTGANGGN